MKKLFTLFFAVTFVSTIFAQNIDYLASDFWRSATPVQVSAGLKSGALDITAQDNDKNTALMLAAMYNSDPKVITVLLDAEPKNVNSDDGNSNILHALASACQKTNNLEVYQKLWQALPPEQAKLDYMLPMLLTYAATNPNKAVTLEILNTGANVQFDYPEGITPLILAAANNPNTEVIDILIKAGSDIEGRNSIGRTPLMSAAFLNPSAAVLSKILQAGGKVDSRDNKGLTALMYAAYNNPNPEVFKLLIKAGALVNDSDYHGVTPLISAGQYNVNTEVLNVLLAAGAKINVQDKDGSTALTAGAQYNKNPQVILLLLKAGADPKIKDFAGKTAWDYIQENENLKDSEAYKALQNLHYNLPAE